MKPTKPEPGLRESRKICPNCGGSVLAAARVCKQCRFRFAGEAPNAENLDQFEGDSPKRKPYGVALVVGFAIVVIVALVVSIPKGSSNDDQGPEISATELEQELSAQIRSKTEVPIDSIECDDAGQRGDVVSCEAIYVGGDSQPILVELQTLEPSVRVQVSLPNE